MKISIDDLKKELGDNYHENDDTVLEVIIERYTSIAVQFSNRKKTDELLKPYIVTAVIEDYLRRGDEGTSSSTEGGQSASYIDIEEKLRKDILPIRIGRP